MDKHELGKKSDWYIKQRLQLTQSKVAHMKRIVHSKT